MGKKKKAAWAINGGFPTVQTKGSDGSVRRIRMIGFVHGQGDDFQRFGGARKAALDKAIRDMKRGEYVLAEGFETSLGRAALEAMGHEGEVPDPQDHMQSALLDHQTRLRFAERFEWYTMFPQTEGELRVIQALDKARSQGDISDITEIIRRDEGECGLRRFFSGGDIPLDLVREMKEKEIRTIKTVTGLPEEDARLYVETKTTFRSFLAARTAEYRSIAMDTTLFMGALHSSEVISFLRHPDAMQAYVDGLPDALRTIVLTNEAYQKDAVAEFLRHREQAISPRFEHLFMRHIAYKAYGIGFGLGRAIDLSEYRQELSGLMSALRPDDKCICNSGAAFGRCCAPLLEPLRSIGSTPWASH